MVVISAPPVVLPIAVPSRAERERKMRIGDHWVERKEGFQEEKRLKDVVHAFRVSQFTTITLIFIKFTQKPSISAIFVAFRHGKTAIAAAIAATAERPSRHAKKGMRFGAEETRRLEQTDGGGRTTVAGRRLACRGR
ncbi:hypothetical protein PIB30_087514 [Stylosanthes scabra]|uniref:Uncharacterized protein n=1 Tax=Stylosanthes scabra TaxID=79078 RepID=A0ABU6XQM8_9FABA|nr:hypothetical protein [Stylosanthes scabra]